MKVLSLIFVKFIILKSEEIFRMLEYEKVLLFSVMNLLEIVIEYLFILIFDWKLVYEIDILFLLFWMIFVFMVFGIIFKWYFISILFE